MTASILLPATDAGVLAQLVLLTLATSAAVWRARHNKDVVLFVLGLFMVAVGLVGLRALH